MGMYDIDGADQSQGKASSVALVKNGISYVFYAEHMVIERQNDKANARIAELTTEVADLKAKLEFANAMNADQDKTVAELTAEVGRLEHSVGLKNVSIARYRNVLESIELTFRDIRLSTERSRSIMADIARNSLKDASHA